MGKKSNNSDYMFTLVGKLMEQSTFGCSQNSHYEHFMFAVWQMTPETLGVIMAHGLHEDLFEGGTIRSTMEQTALCVLIRYRFIMGGMCPSCKHPDGIIDPQSHDCLRCKKEVFLKQRHPGGIRFSQGHIDFCFPP